MVLVEMVLDKVVVEVVLDKVVVDMVDIDKVVTFVWLSLWLTKAECRNRSSRSSLSLTDRFDPHSAETPVTSSSAPV